LLSSITKGKNPKEWQKENFKRLNIWYQRRDNYIKDYLHKTATKIINTAIEKGIKTIAVGYNKLWKNKCNIGRKNNEKFLSISHSKLLQYIKYKAAQHKIEVIETKESYTSKCDALALEPIQKHEKYLGKRIKRGIFQSSIGRLINADVNGALNILRKSVACDSLIREIAGRGLVFQPVRVYIHPYKPSYKGSSLYNA
jgi:IS605 OrfB family transposase